MKRALFLALAWCGANAALAQSYKVDPEAGRNTFTAVFDAPLGERIMANTSAVDCHLKVEGVLATGHCQAALTSIKVDSDETKSDHFHQWSTNKKMPAEKCKYEVAFEGAKLAGPLAAGQKTAFDGKVKVTVCGRNRADGGLEPVTGSVALLPDGTLRIRAAIKDFNRESYGVSPKATEGWLAKVQQLAPVVAAVGDIEVNIFATPDKVETK